MRIDSRAHNEPRRARIMPGYLRFAEGSALIELGLTKVLCSASIEERVPPFVSGPRQGWVTAEYGMLPRSTPVRTRRERALGRGEGRRMEIERLIGRSLRAVTDLEGLGPRTVVLDCDVIQADGGTRTAAITAAYVALYQALLELVRRDVLASLPIRCGVAAISVGMVDGQLMLDMCYEEDFRAEVDFNVVMTDTGQFVEVQGTAEKSLFSRQTMNEVLALAETGICYMFQVQQEAVRNL
ncbi:MAG: ribonuclease PH [Chloroflexi bacterium]|nr:ribonuclease PH [Chloroflexota bacterium]